VPLFLACIDASFVLVLDLQLGQSQQSSFEAHQIPCLRSTALSLDPVLNLFPTFLPAILGIVFPDGLPLFDVEDSPRDIRF
jgi:hypothetical protein